MQNKRLIIRKLPTGYIEVLIQEKVKWLFFQWWRFYNSNQFIDDVQVSYWVHHLMTIFQLKESDVVDKTINKHTYL